MNYGIRYLRTPSRYAVITCESIQEARAILQDVTFGALAKPEIVELDLVTWSAIND